MTLAHDSKRDQRNKCVDQSVGLILNMVYSESTGGWFLTIFSQSVVFMDDILPGHFFGTIGMAIACETAALTEFFLKVRKGSMVRTGESRLCANCRRCADFGRTQ